MTRILTSFALLFVLGSSTSCKAPAPAGTASDTTMTAAAAEHPIDSLVPDTHILDLADGTEVWLIPGRVGRAENGSPCLERGVQLRKGALKITVPLLYTSAMPVVVDGKLVAAVSNNCVTGQTYAIDPGTGQPTKWERRAR